ncbi:hypothetical protein BO78DRAFT_182589 [Aspergillus sclerotiicarbonarius CBS 121057]|uniref:Uncharacterized protein n=1 Tax=Aspergillus sclerotiicarbonarius (strain CBS 121057 / IBT 28362) TaxID=1448318 RepID=A0A319EM77_ASPSB|nr:hypothetical protein BO78DRAFT_182589 [Aspergillus sclerotiicarbonarius CBS 121057]
MGLLNPHSALGKGVGTRVSSAAGSLLANPASDSGRPAAPPVGAACSSQHDKRLVRHWSPPACFWPFFPLVGFLKPLGRVTPDRCDLSDLMGSVLTSTRLLPSFRLFLPFPHFLSEIPPHRLGWNPSFWSVLTLNSQLATRNIPETRASRSLSRTDQQQPNRFRRPGPGNDLNHPTNDKLTITGMRGLSPHGSPPRPSSQLPFWAFRTTVADDTI